MNYLKNQRQKILLSRNHSMKYCYEINVSDGRRCELEATWGFKRTLQWLIAYRASTCYFDCVCMCDKIKFFYKVYNKLLFICASSAVKMVIYIGFTKSSCYWKYITNNTESTINFANIIISQLSELRFIKHIWKRAIRRLNKRNKVLYKNIVLL